MTFKALSPVDRRDRMIAVLRSLVSDAAYTQRQIAEIMDIPKSKVGYILTGQQRMEFIEIVDWLDALDISTEKFFELLDSPPPLED